MQAEVKTNLPIPSHVSDALPAFVSVIAETKKNITENFYTLGQCLAEVRNRHLYKGQGFDNFYQFLRDKQIDISPKDAERFIAITEDDESLIVNAKPAPKADTNAIRIGERTASGKERTLVLGWNEKGTMIINELDAYVGNGSEILVVSDVSSAENDTNALKKGLQKQKLSYTNAAITERTVLDAVDVKTFDHIIILCSNEKPVQEADAEVLITLLHLRNISEQYDINMSIVSEMRDVRNRALAEIAKADDFIVSDKLVSLLLSQISENKHLEKVFKDLFRSEGSEVYIRSMKDYIEPGKKVDFYTVIEAAAQRGETAIGYRVVEHSQNADKAYGVVVNPKKSAQVAYAEGDKIIVLAED